MRQVDADGIPLVIRIRVSAFSRCSDDILTVLFRIPVRLVPTRDGVKIACLLLLTGAGAAAQPVNLSGPWKLSLVDNPRWAQPDADDSSWPAVILPQRTPRNERIYWLRRTVLAPTLTGQLQVTVGLVSESYEIYANGFRIGDTGDFGKPEVGFFQPRSFRLPPGAVRPGSRLVISLRIWNTGARGGPDKRIAGSRSLLDCQRRAR